MGGAYAISAGLIIYADQNGLPEVGLRFALLMVWAIAGLVLAGIAATRRPDK